MTILTAKTWRTNADLIAEVAQLGYLRDDWITLDPTWGRGLWWTKWHPKKLIKHDLYTLDGVDFRRLPEADDSVDVVAFDPTYVSVGGRDTTTIPDFHNRFGMDTAPSTPKGVQDMINLGLKELQRALKPKRFLLVKSQNYVSSGKLWMGTHKTVEYALGLGFEVMEQFQHIGHARAQPAGRRQVHARQNYSTLTVFKNKK